MPTSVTLLPKPWRSSTIRSTLGEPMWPIAYLAVILALFASGLWGWGRVLLLWVRHQLVRHDAWYLAGAALVALLAGLWLSRGAARTTETSVIYGLPLPVVGFEQNRLGQWSDFSSPLSFWFAAFNVVFWLSLPGPFLAFLLRRRGAKAEPRS
jgi:hypothetical protein